MALTGFQTSMLSYTFSHNRGINGTASSALPPQRRLLHTQCSKQALLYCNPLQVPFQCSSIAITGHLKLQDPMTASKNVSCNVMGHRILNIFSRPFNRPVENSVRMVQLNLPMPRGSQGKSNQSVASVPKCLRLGPGARRAWLVVKFLGHSTEGRGKDNWHTDLW